MASSLPFAEAEARKRSSARPSTELFDILDLDGGVTAQTMRAAADQALGWQGERGRPPRACRTPIEASYYAHCRHSAFGFRQMMREAGEALGLKRDGRYRGTCR